MATYRLEYDLHTHTSFSHGSGSIEDNVLAAKAAGLKRLGIADHGPGHLFFGIRRSRLPEMRREIERLRAVHPDMEILLGVEANIINSSGLLDVRPWEFGDYDYVIAGYHYGVLGDEPLRAFGLACANIAQGMTGREFARLRRENTAMVARALRENDIMILTHPGDKAPVDLPDVAAACAETGTLFEINTGHDCVSPEDMRAAARAGAAFVISSDAHSPGRVGDFMPAVELAARAGIGLERIVNLIVE
ncbi:MAG: PHP domain-containing protein [Clostridiales Family XIII bacterium]|nr:PHP domain-containing protein [Clostridiales Family XIII bacterium]